PLSFPTTTISFSLLSFFLYPCFHRHRRQRRSSRGLKSWQHSKRCVLILLACFSSLTTSPADLGGLICDRETLSRPQDLGISTPASSRPQDPRLQDPRHQDLKRPPSGSSPS
ncbi:hypothetical protein B0H14DRAFT_2669813, partial [Mycena olivaceomarginata]